MFIAVLGFAAVVAGGSAPGLVAAEPALTPAPRSMPARPEPEDSQVIAELDVVMAPYRDPELSVDRFARKMAVPTRRVSVAVNRVKRINVSQYVNEFRIGDACRRLAEDEPIMQIMFEVGFSPSPTSTASGGVWAVWRCRWQVPGPLLPRRGSFRGEELSEPLPSLRPRAAGAGEGVVRAAPVGVGLEGLDDRREGCMLLMQAVETEARIWGCRPILLETHSFQAPDFNRKLGFEVTGQVAATRAGAPIWRSLNGLPDRQSRWAPFRGPRSSREGSGWWRRLHRSAALARVCRSPVLNSHFPHSRKR
jgi:AraC-like DNA-binding protein